jgi:hypothetical protein
MLSWPIAVQGWIREGVEIPYLLHPVRVRAFADRFGH